MNNIFIDPRAGSKYLARPLAKYGARLSTNNLPHGDILITANGPNGKLFFIGVEVKTPQDFIASIQSNRLQQTQLPSMFKSGCKIVYVFVYGKTRKRPDGKYESLSNGYWHELKGGKLADPAVRKAIYHELAYHNVHCKEFDSEEELCEEIGIIAKLWSRPYEAHKLMTGFDTTSLPTRNQRKGFRKIWPTEAEYNMGLLASVLPDVGAKGAKNLSMQFTSVAEMLYRLLFTDPNQCALAATIMHQQLNDKKLNMWAEVDTFGKKTIEKVLRFLTIRKDISQ